MWNLLLKSDCLLCNSEIFAKILFNLCSFRSAATTSYFWLDRRCSTTMWSLPSNGRGKRNNSIKWNHIRVWAHDLGQEGVVLEGQVPFM